jgi:hypothetical protein
MKKRLVVRRKPVAVIKAICGKFKGQKIQLLKRGFSGWHGKKVDTGEMIYLFPEEVP